MLTGSSIRQLVTAEGEAVPTALPNEARNILWPRLSPDGKRVAMTIRNGGQTDVWVYDLPHGPHVRVSNEGVQNDRPEWMPDGKSLLFRSTRGPRAALWVQPVDGTRAAQVLLSHPVARIDEGAVSPDGRYVLYQIDSTGVADLLYRALAPDSQPHPVATSPAAELSGRFSPDGKWVAYTSAESGITQAGANGKQASG